ncbi:MAG: HEAT repeat domain-containing protein [Planctomycetes bacterium]|nr:HEAT repeat domain-containing protein [Planctomycetota bacterium]
MSGAGVGRAAGRRGGRLAAGGALLLALAAGAARPQEEDDGDPVGPDRGPTAGERLFLPLEDDLADALRRVDDLAARGQWDRVVEALDRLLEGGRATLAPGEGQALRGARGRARAATALPPEGRDAIYAQLHDDAARRLLEDARGRADPAPLLELLARHPGSRAAFAARTLLASRLLERGQPAGALAQVDALLARPGLDPADRAGLLRARVLALALLGRQGEVDDALARLGPDAGDVAARAAAVSAALAPPTLAPPERPGVRAWAQPVLGYYETAQGGSRAWSVPEVQGGRAYAHDGSHALCVDVATGKLVWRAPLRPEDAFRRPTAEGDHRVVLTPGQALCVVPGVGVVSLERETGRERWRRGLPALKRDAGIDFPARLSGTPRAVGGRLVLALVTEHETREVHALALDLPTGALAWTAFLAGQTQGPVPQVELAGTDDRVVVLTGLGLVAALDAEGELLWARRYASVRDERERRPRGPIPGMGPPPADRPERAPTALVVRGTVWAAPADGKQLLALDLRGGAVEAVVERPERGRLVAARGTELVVLSAEGDVFVTTKAGSTLVAQAGGTLVGRPVVAGARVYLPRDDGLVEVDLATKQARRAGPPAPELGQLAAADGLVVSASPRGLFAFGRDPGAPPGLPDDLLLALADDLPGVRDAASAALLERGEPARAGLARAAASADAEVAFRAKVLQAELDRKDRLARWGPLVKPEWTAQVPDLLNRLTHPNAEVRLEALRELGAVQDPDVGRLLADLCADPDDRVAFTAAGALLARGDRAGVDLLARAVREGHPGDRLAALVALRAHGKADDVDRAAPALADAEADVRAAAVVAVLTLGGAAALPRVEPLLEDPADEVRVALVDGLSARAGEPACLRLLASLVRDKNDQVRATVVDALVKVKDPVAYRALGQVLGDPVATIARQALGALYKLAQSPHVMLIPPDAIERAARTKDPQQRDHVAQLAIRYVGRGGVLSVATLARFLADEEPQIRAWRLGGRSWTVLLLEHVRQHPLSPADVAALGRLVAHEDPDIRIKGYQVLGNAALAPGAGALLARGLDDAHPQLRADCARWLTRPDAPPDLLDEDAALEMLRIAALSPRPEGKQAAADALRGVPRAVLAPALLRAARVPNEALQADAGARLTALTGGAPAWDPARPERSWRALAAWWWAQTHGGQSSEETIRRLVDDNPTARWQAARDLATLPTPGVRNALAASLAQEPLEWVLEAKLEALTAVLGEALGYKKGLPPAERRACADRLRLRVVELIQDEVREDARRAAPR